jgi:hypothetical protein
MAHPRAVQAGKTECLPLDQVDRRGKGEAVIAENPQTYAEMVAADRAAALDDILSRWHSWQGGFKAVRGFKGRALVVGDFRISRQYDADNGALDDEIEDAVMQQVDFEVNEMGDPHRSAIYALARALSLGLMVFSSARLPADPREKQIIINTARGILIARLVGAGVI